MDMQINWDTCLNIEKKTLDAKLWCEASHYLYAWYKPHTSQHGDKPYSLYPKGWDSASRTMESKICLLSSFFVVFSLSFCYIIP